MRRQASSGAPIRLARARSQMQVRRAEDAGDDADGELGRGERPPGDEVGRRAAAARPRARRGRWRAGAPTSRRAIGRGDERDERDRTGRRGRDRGAARRRPTISAARDRSTRDARDPWRCRRRAAARAAGGPRHSTPGTSTTIARATGRTWSQPRPLSAAGQPHRGPLRVEDLGPRQQVGGDRRRASPRHRCRRAPAGRTTRPAGRRA